MVDTEDGVHPIDFHVGPNPGNPTRKSDLALRFVQGNFIFSGRPSIQFFTMLEDLQKSLDLRAWMDFAPVMGKRLPPPTQYVSEI